jgi:hypothetical protein
MQRRVRQRASDLGLSLAEYIRRLVDRDLGGTKPVISPKAVFDLGRSEGSDIAKRKDAMLREAFASERRKSRRHQA